MKMKHMMVQFDSVENEEWEVVASEIVRSYMKASRVNFVQLASLLARFGHEGLNTNLSARVNRGRFSAAFLLQCLSVLGVESLSVPTAAGADGGIEGSDPRARVVGGAEPTRGADDAVA